MITANRSNLFFLVWALLIPLQSSAVIEHGYSRPFAEDSFNSLSLPFIANTGQLDKRVSFYASTFAGTVFVTQEGELVYALQSGTAKNKVDGQTGWVLKEQFPGAVKKPEGLHPSKTRISRYIGNDPTHWRDDVPAYQSVSMGKLWSGVELEVKAYGNNVEKLFTLSPHADIAAIRVQMKGAAVLRVTKEGALVAETELGDVIFSKPVAYQEIAGLRKNIAVSYQVQGKEYGFQLGAYDRSLPVIIDPILQSTYLGGSGDEDGATVAVASTGKIYVAGTTTSSNFPGTAGGAQSSFAGGLEDIFVARLDATLMQLEQVTYIGGSDDDIDADIVVDDAGSGDVFLVGSTGSDNLSFVTASSFQPNRSGQLDAFVVRFDPSLTTNSGLDIPEASYLGGPQVEFTGGIVIHPTTGDVLVVGETFSQPVGFSGIDANSAQQNFGGGQSDVFVSRMNNTFTQLHQSTYLGGNGDDESTRLAVDPGSGDIIVVGETSSSNFPNATNSFAGGPTDTFVARLNDTLTSGTNAIYLGGNGEEDHSELLVAANGDIIIAGETDSNTLTGGANNTNQGGFDLFLIRIGASLMESAIQQATFLGGSGDDTNPAIAFNGSGLVIVGETTSTNFPNTAGGAQAGASGGQDFVVANLDTGLMTAGQATYLGGSGDEDSPDVAVDASGNVVVVGETGSNNLPVAINGFGGGSSDAFATLISGDLAAVIPPVSVDISDSIEPANDQSLPFGMVKTGTTVDETVTLTNTGSTDVDIAISAGPVAPFSLINAAACDGVTLAPSANCMFTVRFSPISDGTVNDSFTLDLNGSDAIVTVSGTGAPASADIIVTKNTSSVLVQPDAADITSFTVSVSNAGIDAADVVVNDLLPPGLQVATGTLPTVSVGNYNPMTGVWDVGTLTPNDPPETLSLDASVPMGTATGCVINTASASFAAGESAFDPDTGNNSADAIVGVNTGLPMNMGCADLAISTVVSDSLILDGLSFLVDCIGVTITVRVTNNGPNLAPGVSLVEDNPITFNPSNVSVFSIHTDNTGSVSGCTSPFSPGLQMSDLGAINSGETVETNIKFSVDSNGGNIDVDYGLSASSNAADPDVSNNVIASGFTIFRTGPSGSGDDGGGGGCSFGAISTGTYLEPRLDIVRSFRDQFLKTNQPGQMFVDWYYRHSPEMVQLLQDQQWLKATMVVLLALLIHAMEYPFLVLAVFVLLGFRRRLGAGYRASS